MKTIFKEGDKVYHIQYGWGKVMGILDTDLGSMVKVKFKFGDKHITFIMNGRLKNLLSFQEYTLEGFSEQRPEPLPNKGDIVWVRDDEDEEWIIAHFLFESDRLYYTTCANPFKDRHSNVNWKYLRTTNPYANEQ